MANTAISDVAASLARQYGDTYAEALTHVTTILADLGYTDAPTGGQAPHRRVRVEQATR